MTSLDVPPAVLFAMDPGFVKVSIAAVFAAAVFVGFVVWWWLGQYRVEHDRPWSCCGSCEALDSPDDEDEDEPDDLMDVAESVGGDVPTPVNEARPGRWVASNRPNDDWFDSVSRVANQQNGRWITGRQQEQAGQSFAGQVEAYLVSPEAARQAQWETAHWDRSETTGEIRRRLGDPGE
ncbi:hypothetical protein FHR83_006633 [Actinoplanes campanulatus]|uniref:Uncharacterized protein n=1 Tax=Actinoplanes campanulatus TaxID=113559 RepID=A0A7W5AMC0_9ACTN|nr:hypothetical protein [Actinoplanes campanulatus]MBB3098927.1 hypothetical protein [Actinoplanes campanulatus]GGN39817.1 hypothetical protein GCM10010109_68230 [Actinoplanes campanulatus]GID40131.1 hypothetical protein Aca09nite_66370 [Actinoplanes campanulatus]